MRVTSLYESKKPVISMEFFPPRNEKGCGNIWHNDCQFGGT